MIDVLEHPKQAPGKQFGGSSNLLPSQSTPTTAVPELLLPRKQLLSKATTKLDKKIY